MEKNLYELLDYVKTYLSLASYCPYVTVECDSFKKYKVPGRTSFHDLYVRKDTQRSFFYPQHNPASAFTNHDGII